MRMTTWHLTCPTCRIDVKKLCWDYELPAKCDGCGNDLEFDTPLVAPGVIGDDIPGGIDIRHGICNPDGTPKRYYSKTEIRRAANEAGYTIGGDTPKPYPVQWSGRKNGDEK